MTKKIAFAHGILFFIVCLIVTFPFAWSYYHEDITRLEAAYSDKLNLYPPTDEEIANYELADKQMQIKQKEAELTLLKLDIPIPDDFGDNYSVEYPNGHNPSKQELTTLINNVNEKIHQLEFSSLGISIIFGVGAGIKSYLDLRKSSQQDNNGVDFGER
ncbi:MAG: hypothetical protein H6Q73_158 [Firmicutes bacterium]|nr:hypothetical protein [Bacillota bacterium]